MAASERTDSGPCLPPLLRPPLPPWPHTFPTRASSTRLWRVPGQSTWHSAWRIVGTQETSVELKKAVDALDGGDDTREPGRAWRKGRRVLSLTAPAPPRPVGAQRLSRILAEVEQPVLEPGMKVIATALRRCVHSYYHTPVVQRKRPASHKEEAFAPGPPMIMA